MAESSATSGEDHHRRHLLETTYHRYFLRRLGLISDEVDWSAEGDEGGTVDEADGVDDGHGGSSSSLWRARDALTSILGRDASAVMSDSGLTSTEMALLEGDLLDSEGGLSSTSSLAVPIAPIAKALFRGRGEDGDCDDGGGNGNRTTLDAEIVRRAFDAAAYAVVRGDRRTSLAVSAPDEKFAGDRQNEMGHPSNGYDPPLVLAMESIRVARIATLNEASGSESVPPFLKKNNTIPWFHVPVQQPIRAVSAVVAAAASSPSSLATSLKAGISVGALAGSVVGGEDSPILTKLSHAGRSSGDVKAKKEHEKTNKKRGPNDIISASGAILAGDAPKSKRAKIQTGGGSTAPAEEGDGAAASLTVASRGGKKERKDQNQKEKDKKDSKDAHSKSKLSGKKPGQSKRATSASSSSKHSTASGSPSSSSSSKPKRAARFSSASVMEDASGVGGSNARTSRAIIGAAVAGVFEEFRRDYDGRNTVTDDEKNCAAEDEIARVASSNDGIFKQRKHDSHSLHPKKKAKEEDTRVDAEEVISQARRLAGRVLDHTGGAARRGDQRREFRMDAALSRVNGLGSILSSAMRVGNPFLARPAHTLPLVCPNPFVRVKSDSVDDDDGAADGRVEWGTGVANGQSNGRRDEELAGGPAIAPQDAEWTESCLPRLLAILGKGAGHTVLHDVRWTDRAFRVASLLRSVASSARDGGRGNYGPHLVVTSGGEDFDAFARAFGGLGHGPTDDGVVGGSGASPPGADVSPPLRVLPYQGSKARRRRLRKHFGSLSPSPKSHFSFLGGLPDSPFHAILTTYSALVEDYPHFCQIPFQVVVLDEGMGWLGCSHYDPHGKIGKVWNSGLWNNFDHGAGRAGVADGGQASAWDFSKDVVDLGEEEKHGSDAGGSAEGRDLIGLTTRHRVLLASNMHARHRGQAYRAPVLGLLSFLAPQFADAIGDGWERSRVSACKNSMTFIRSVVARLVVVYAGDPAVRFCAGDSIALSLKALQGELPLRPPSVDRRDFEDEEVDELIKSQKIVHSRKFAAAWFPPCSSMREELGKISLDSILAAVKRVNAMGFVCEELVSASSLTTSGAGGCVVGLSAYRPAVRCGRSFSSDQGLRQHIISSHAPPGTWLCRSCGEDCGTSQARTTHERACGKPQGSVKRTSPGSAAPPAGQETSKTRGRKKKEVKNPVILEKQSAKKLEGSNGVPGYKGVWAHPSGSYFLKVGGKPVLENDSEKETPLLFDSAALAAKKFDEIIIERGKVQEQEMNYKSDGSKIVHKDEAVSAPATKSAEPSGGEASGTNPDLSVIDIKDLPPHVKPLLRDPSQTSRTGGNSKRYVYAYRGVCRQQRKGHDRWQSQISFNGTNHYLGTFDSEWDAAAVYAWAHLILYGEEATKKAQLEGEEAAAAFEQHEKDIAEGKIPPPSPSKPAKKKKRGAPRKNPQKTDKGGRSLGNKPREVSKREILPESKGNSLVGGMHAPTHRKKDRPMSQDEWNKLKTECAMMLSSGTKGTSKATILATRKDIAGMNEKQLLRNVSNYLSGNLSMVSKSVLLSGQPPDISRQFPASVSSEFVPPMLLGLSASDAAWEIEKFIQACRDAGARNALATHSKLNDEFGAAGANTSFRTFLLSTSCTLGRASKVSRNMFLPSGHVNGTLGMPVGNIECNVGGPDYSCSEMAARIRFLPSRYSNFQFMAFNNDDIVTLNGQRMSAKRGPLPLRDRDVCSVGARVFVFIEKITF